MSNFISQISITIESNDQVEKLQGKWQYLAAVGAAVERGFVTARGTARAGTACSGTQRGATPGRGTLELCVTYSHRSCLQDILQNTYSNDYILIIISHFLSEY